MVEVLSGAIHKDIKFHAAAVNAVSGAKRGKVKRFVCPLCGAWSLAKKENDGRIKAYCQGCGISCMG